MITTGKHKGKTFEHVLANDEPYCRKILNGMRISNDSLSRLKIYLEEHMTSTIDTTKLHHMHRINAMKLIDDYMIRDVDISKVCSNIEFKECMSIKYGYPQFVIDSKIQSIYGQFMDYLMRHYIMSKTDSVISDSRTSSVVEYHPSLRKSYDIYCSNKDTRSIISHIWNVCIGHSVVFGSMESMMYLDIDEKFIEDDVLNYVISSCDKIISRGEDIMCNPDIGSPYLGVQADADIVYGNTILDIKTSTKNISSRRNKLQLILYASLYRHKYDKKLHRLILFNPLGSMCIANISNIDFENDIIDIITRYSIGSSI